MANGKTDNWNFPGPVPPSLAPLMSAREKAAIELERAKRDVKEWDTRCRRCAGLGCPKCCPADAS